jgi:phospholipase/carboxylesterase
VLRKAVLGIALVLTTWSSCGAAPDERVGAEHVENGVRVRDLSLAGFRYLEVVPARAAPDAELPLVVWLHGRGDAPQAPDGPFLGLDRMRLVLPQAPERFHRGYAWLPVSAAPGQSAALVRGLRTRSDELARFIRELEERHPTRGRPIVAGFSQGGMLTMTLAIHHPDVVGDAFPIAGWLPPALSSVSGPTPVHPPIRAMHGAVDAVLPAPRTERAVGSLARRGYDVELRVYDGVGHETSPDMWRQLRKWLRRALAERDAVPSLGMT